MIKSSNAVYKVNGKLKTGLIIIGHNPGFKSIHAYVYYSLTKNLLIMGMQNQTFPRLGAFSTSLSVKNLADSKAFYEKLGFQVFAGKMEQNYLIMKNGNALIGLFQGMFQGNILTFNPGWDENAQDLAEFDDVRAIEKHLKEKGIDLIAETNPEEKQGPASFTLTDPDGNVILVDQHR